MAVCGTLPSLSLFPLLLPFPHHSPPSTSLHLSYPNCPVSFTPPLFLPAHSSCFHSIFILFLLSIPHSLPPSLPFFPCLPFLYPLSLFFLSPACKLDVSLLCASCQSRGRQTQIFLLLFLQLPLCAAVFQGSANPIHQPRRMQLCSVCCQEVGRTLLLDFRFGKRRRRRRRRRENGGVDL